MAQAQDDGDDVISQINVTPLVDVMLVLLVVMMVTASTVVARSLDVQLPKGSTGTQSEQPLLLTVKSDGQLLLDGQPLSEPALRSLAASKVSADPQVRAVIAADGEVAHRHVVRVMDLLRTERLTHVGIGVMPGEG